jgi:PAS domain S-box-containing protein
MLNPESLLTALPVAAYITDTEGTITSYNEAAVALWGQRPAQGAKWSGFSRLYALDGSVLPFEGGQLATALKEGRAVRGSEVLAERRDGSRVHIIPYPTPLKDETGRTVGAINVLVDTGHQKEAETLAARLAAIVTSSDDAIISKTLDGYITFWNDSAERIFGYTAKEMIGQHITRLIPLELRHEEDEIISKLRAGKRIEHFETVRMAKNGRRINVSLTVSPMRNNAGDIIGASKVARDITDRKQAEAESARLAAIVTSSDDAIISKTLDGVIASWNAGAERIFGYEADEIIGQHITRIIPPELHDEEDEILARLREGQRIDHYETARVTKDGRRVDISLTVSPLRNDAGEVIGASKVSRDITEKKQAEKLQLLLVEELNHRVKNTLATVQAIANQSLVRSKSHKDFVSSFSGRLQALAKLHTLLTQTRMQGTELAELIATQVRLGSPDEDRVSINGPFLFLGAQEASHLGMVLHELTTNARKYGALSVPTGRLEVTWEVRSNGGRRLFLTWGESSGPKVRAPDARGFGLTLIEQTVRVHGGEASMHFAEDGLKCRIDWPLAEVPQEALSTATMRFSDSSILPTRVSPSLNGKRILIVEDEPLVAMDMQSMLSGAGCVPLGPAGSLDEAKRILATAKCDAALVDVNLRGEPIEGLLPLLREKGVPFAFVTGYGPKVLSKTFEETVTISKPFSAEQLLAVTEVLVYLRGAGSEVVPLKKKHR